MKQNRFISFSLMLIVYLVTMGLYYNHTHSIIIEETEKNIEDTLLIQRALSFLVSDIQKPEVFKLQAQGYLHKDYFSPALLSSSYVTIKLNELSNIEREKLGIAPLVYRYASANPINPSNLADSYDMKIFQKLQDPSVLNFKDIITDDNKKYLYYAIAGKTITVECLQCHGRSQDAPKQLIERYGDKNGFGYKVGDLSSIISIKAPLDGIYEKSDQGFFILASIIFILFVSLFVLTDIIQAGLSKKDKEVKEARKKQKQSTKKAKELEDSINKLYDHVISSQFDTHGNLIQASDALIQLCGYSREELLGRPFCFFKHPDTSEALFKDMWMTLMEGKTWNAEVKNLTKNGEIFWVEVDISPKKDENNITYAFDSIMRVITEKKTLLEDINIDPLTQLLNRRTFEQCVTTEQARAKRDKKYLALIMVDIDFFKQYNDHYGHLQGDRALQDVAKSLKNSFRRSSDFIFRLGGEEFAILTSEYSISQLHVSADTACYKLHQEHIEHIESTIDPFLTISLGVAILTHESELNYQTIYDESDKALYKAKNNGRNRVEYTEL